MSTVAKIDIPYVQVIKDRYGKVRYYYRRLGYKRVTLQGEPGSAEFATSYEAAKKLTKPSASSPGEGPRSIGALIAHYYMSSDYRALKPGTTKVYRNVLERFRTAHGTKPVSEVEPKHLNAIFHTAAKTPAASAVLRKRLRAIFELAKDLGWRSDNPVNETKKIKRAKTEGFIPWSEEDIAAYEARWPSGTRERLALYLLLYTGQRRSDVVSMGRQHVKAGRISVRQLKTDARLQIMLHPKLQAEIELVPADQLTFMVTAYGKPFTPPGFTNWFVGTAKAAGLVKRTPHGLRKAQGRRLAEAGCTGKQIASILGHATLAEVERYTRDAAQMLLADQAIGKLQHSGEGAP